MILAFHAHRSPRERFEPRHALFQLHSLPQTARETTSLASSRVSTSSSVSSVLHLEHFHQEKRFIGGE